MNDYIKSKTLLTQNSCHLIIGTSMHIYIYKKTQRLKNKKIENATYMLRSNSKRKKKVI